MRSTLSPKGARGRVILSLAPLGERVARRGVFISRGETGEGVSPIVKSNMGHHTRLGARRRGGSGILT